MVPRIFWYTASLIVSSIARYRADGETSANGFAICMMLLLVCELIFFVQEKAQVKLFVSSKVIKLQEQQLLDMLDSVPDKVLVCTNDRDKDVVPRPLYNNL